MFAAGRLLPVLEVSLGSNGLNFNWLCSKAYVSLAIRKNEVKRGFDAGEAGEEKMRRR